MISHIPHQTTNDMTYLAISEDRTGGGSSVLSRVDGVGLGRSDSDD